MSQRTGGQNTKKAPQIEVTRSNNNEQATQNLAPYNGHK